MAKMERLEKLEGVGNVKMVEAEIPSPGNDEVLIKVRRSLISRGSELFRRYVMPGAIPPHMMGYSDAGDVIEVGDLVEGVVIGERSNVGGPHAQYVVGPHGNIPDGLDYEAATFIGLATSSVMWARTTPIKPGDVVVVLGQGIVGNLYMQAVRERLPSKVITVDANKLRCDISQQCGADMVVDVSKTDSVEFVMDITDGKGADVVVDTTGNARVIESAYELTHPDGKTILVGVPRKGDNISIYSLPLHFNKVLTGSEGGGSIPHVDIPRYIRLHQAGQFNLDGLVTHEFSLDEVNDAIDVVRSGECGRCMIDMSL